MKSRTKSQAHTSAAKEVDFLHADLEYQVQVGHIAVSPWESISYLPELWLSPVAAIPQVGR